MANTILTSQVITNELLRRFENQLNFSKTIRHEFDSKYARGGAYGKIGDTLNIRVPVKFTAVSGAAISVQDVTETQVPLVIDQQYHTAFKFTSADLTLKIDDFSERYLKSAAVALANAVESYNITQAYYAVNHAVGTPGTVPNTFSTFTDAGAVLDDSAAPVDDERYVLLNPKTQSKMVDALKGLFQSSEQIKKQYLKGRMGTAAGFDWMMAQNIPTHTVGPLGGTPLVNGASQTGSSLVTDGWTAAAASRLKKGDIFTIAGVYKVNPVSGNTLTDLEQFVVTADVSSDGSGNATIPIYPAITTSGAYKTVSASPADNAAITVLGAAGTLSPQNLAYHREAFAMAMVPLEVPQGVHFAAAQTNPDTHVSMRIVSQYDISTDAFITRADVMWGFKTLLPTFACRIAS